MSTLHHDELIGKLKVYEVVLKKDSEASKNKKEKYKSLFLKAKESSEEETSSSDSKDEEYAMAVRDFKNLVRRRGNNCPKHSYNDQKEFVGGSWSNSDEGIKKDEICLMAHKSNEVIHKNKHLKTKNELIDNEVFELKERLKRLEKNKGLNEECKSGLELRRKNESLASKLSKFENSNHYLKELLESQSENADKRAFYVPDLADLFERDLASTVEGIRAPDAATTKLKPSMPSRTNLVHITKKTSPSATVENTKQPPANLNKTKNDT
ncbi:hypothetical protein Tco_1482474 [Tanacetum coccineum]